MSTENNTESSTSTSWVSTWLQSLGMSQTWANIIATAVISAVTAILAMMQTSCDLASVTSDPTTTTLVGNDGSVAIISATDDDWFFSWTQASVEVEEDVILVEEDAK